MIFGSMNNGRFEIFRQPIRTSEKHIFTNNPKILRAHGIYPVRYTTPSDTDEQHAIVGSHMELIEEEYVQVWDIEEVEIVSETDNLSDSEALRIILEGE